MPRLDPADLLVYVIIDPAHLNGRDLESVSDAVLSAGVRTLQLRQKSGTPAELLARAEILRRLTTRHDALFIVNDHVDVALEVGADGVHVGPHDTAVSLVRERAPDLLIGASAGTVERALALQEEGADYLGCGAVWSAHASKPNASPPRGLEMITSIAAAVSIPIVGIGGVTAERTPDLIAAGASGAAVIRAVLAHPDPASAAQELLRAASSAAV